MYIAVGNKKRTVDFIVSNNSGYLPRFLTQIWTNEILSLHLYNYHVYNKADLLFYIVHHASVPLTLSLPLPAGLIGSAGRMRSHRGRGKQHEWPVHLD